MFNQYQKYIFIIVCTISSFWLIACRNSNRDKAFKEIKNTASTVQKDLNGIKGVQIGSQVWSAQNLSVSTFKNGEVIYHAQTEEQWETAGSEGVAAWCYYNNDSANGAKYGKLYNWYAVNDPRGLAPEGWHIPSSEEWTTMSDFLGGDDVAGLKLKSDTGWADKGNGTNIAGFSALPGGYRYFGGLFFNAGLDGGWWTSTESGEGFAMLRYLYSVHNNVFTNRLNSKLGMSVRCVQD